MTREEAMAEKLVSRRFYSGFDMKTLESRLYFWMLVISYVILSYFIFKG